MDPITLQCLIIGGERLVLPLQAVELLVPNQDLNPDCQIVWHLQLQQWTNERDYLKRNEKPKRNWTRLERKKRGWKRLTRKRRKMSRGSRGEKKRGKRRTIWLKLGVGDFRLLRLVGLDSEDHLVETLIEDHLEEMIGIEIGEMIVDLNLIDVIVILMIGEGMIEISVARGIQEIGLVWDREGYVRLASCLRADGQAFEPSSYRPAGSPPPLSARLDRARSPPRRALSPMGRRSPPRRALSPMGRPRSRSPPRGQGDSYRPDRDGPILPPPRGPISSPADFRNRRDPRPTFAEPMSGYAVCPSYLLTCGHRLIV
jgi:hypothetical protein